LFQVKLSREIVEGMISMNFFEWQTKALDTKECKKILNALKKSRFKWLITEVVFVRSGFDLRQDAASTQLI
jgi:hypothetical protein